MELEYYKKMLDELKVEQTEQIDRQEQSWEKILE